MQTARKSLISGKSKKDRSPAEHDGMHSRRRGKLFRGEKHGIPFLRLGNRRYKTGEQRISFNTIARRFIQRAFTNMVCPNMRAAAPFRVDKRKYNKRPVFHNRVSCAGYFRRKSIRDSHERRKLSLLQRRRRRFSKSPQT